MELDNNNDDVEEEPIIEIQLLNQILEDDLNHGEGTELQKMYAILCNDTSSSESESSDSDSNSDSDSSSNSDSNSDSGSGSSSDSDDSSHCWSKESELDRIAKEEENTKIVGGFASNIEAYSDEEFETNMRCRRSTVEYLITRYYASDFEAINFCLEEGIMRKRMAVYIYIWYVCNGVNFRELGNLFEVDEIAVALAVRNISLWLVSVGEEFIQWPQMPTENKQMPGAIGAIGCTHFAITVPEANKEYYLNKKGQYSLAMQAVVDSDGKFINITGGEPGSLKDQRILERSDLSLRIQTNYKDLLPNYSFILGGSAYAATSWLVPPFRDNGNLNDTQINFNSIHSANLEVVSNAFAILKGRWRLLETTQWAHLDKLSNIIVSTCILHNICIERGDLYTDIAPQEPNKSLPENIATDSVVDKTEHRREKLFNYMQSQNII